VIRKLLPALAATLVLVSTKAAAAPDNMGCKATVSPASSLVRVLYDPFQNAQEVQEVELALDTSGNKDCRFAVALAGSGTTHERVLRTGSGTLRYEAQLNGSVIVNDVNAPLPLASGSTNGAQRNTLKLIVPQGQFAPSGTYDDQLRLRLYALDGGTPRQLGTDLVIAASAIIPARAQINLAGSSSPVFGNMPAAGLYFGDLREGAERDAYIQVRATSPVVLTVSSQNKGEMLHKVDAGLSRGIPYDLSVESQSLDLRSGPKRIDRTPGRGLQAENYRLAVRILDTDQRLAGTYEDIVTITVEPK
jgi:spore coat protein U-like protein